MNWFKKLWKNIIIICMEWMFGAAEGQDQDNRPSYGLADRHLWLIEMNKDVE